MMGDDPLDLSGVPMMGLHGVSKSAKDRKKNGLVYFNHFLEEVAQSKEATPKKWEDMAEAEICRVELFQAFGEFMKNRPNTGRGEPLSISTAQDFMWTVPVLKSQCPESARRRRGDGAELQQGE
jgi:hypothetical protein